MPPARAAATVGVLCALAVALSFLERLLTAAVPLPPGAKLGLANVCVTFAVSALGFFPALVVALFRSFFVFLTAGGLSAVMSLSGGLCSLAVTALLARLVKKEKISWFSVSILSACAHNVGQLAAACVVGSAAPGLLLTGLMLLFGLAFGSLTGVVLNTLVPALSGLRADSR